MYLEIDGKSYYIHPKTDDATISIVRIKDSTVHLNVPALMPKQNLITYIRQELPKQIVKYNKSTIVELQYINLFDKKFPVQLMEKMDVFISHEVVYTHKNYLSSSRKLDQLKSQLLLNFINIIMSTLEEELEVILPEINLKKFKTKYYSICHNRQRITYSKTLIDKSKDFITYVIILTVGNFLESSEEQINFLINKYVSNAKHCERIYKYEQQ